ncbi:MAG: hypothetical protein IJ586_02335 [Alloprevotella sp.]|nr:hypothetical protein [Alloprevotella sp.]
MTIDVLGYADVRRGYMKRRHPACEKPRQHYETLGLPVSFCALSYYGNPLNRLKAFSNF